MSAPVESSPAWRRSVIFARPDQTETIGEPTVKIDTKASDLYRIMNDAIQFASPASAQRATTAGRRADAAVGQRRHAILRRLRCLPLPRRVHRSVFQRSRQLDGELTMNTHHTAAIVAAKALLGLTIAFGSIITPALHHSAVASPVCLEDQPCWDCSTMGNLQCGSDK